MDIVRFCNLLKERLNGDDESPLYDIQYYTDGDGNYHVRDDNGYLDLTNDTWSTDVFLDLLDEFNLTFDFTDNDSDYIVEEY